MCKVKFNTHISDDFEVKKGLRQRYLLLDDTGILKLKSLT